MVAQVRLRDSGGTLRTAARIRMRDDGNVLRTIQRIRIRDASNVLRTVWQVMTASISPASSNGYYRGSSGADQNISTSAVIATPSGGTGPFTYAWAQIGVSPYTWTIGSAATASTGFTAMAVGAGITAETVFEVTVTDSGGATATVQVIATAYNESTA